MIQKWKFLYYFMFSTHLFQANIVYIDSLSQNASEMQDYFYENFYKLDNITDIQILINNMTFILNETFKLAKSLSLISLGMNNSLILKNCSLAIQNTSFAIQGFSLTLLNLDIESSIFLVSGNGSLVLEVRKIFFSSSNINFLNIRA